MLIALVLLSLACGIATPASVDMFLKVDNINGESQDYAHPAEIDVLDWSWGLSKASGTNPVSVTDLSVTKYVDSASPYLMAMCAKGTMRQTVTLTLRSVGDHPVGFFRIALTKVIVTAVTMGGSCGEHRLIEKIALNFAEMTLTYRPVISALPRISNSFTWDVPTNDGVADTGVVPEPNPARGLASTLIYTNGTRTIPLAWASSAGESYQVWAADTPHPPFQRYGSPLTSAGNGTTTIHLPANAIKKFFLIETLLPQ